MRRLDRLFSGNIALILFFQRGAVILDMVEAIEVSGLWFAKQARACEIAVHQDFKRGDRCNVRAPRFGPAAHRDLEVITKARKVRGGSVQIAVAVNSERFFGKLMF